MVLCEYNGFDIFCDTMNYIGEEDINFAIMTWQHIEATDRDYDNYNRLMEVKSILIKYAPDRGLISNIVDCEFNVINSELLVSFCEIYEYYKYWCLIIKDIFCCLYTNDNIYDYYEYDVNAIEIIFDYYYKTIIPRKTLSGLSNTPNKETQEPQTPILPPELSTPEAMRYWMRAQEAGLVDEHYIFVKKITQQQKVYFIHRLCKSLGHENKWKGLEPFTGMNTNKMADVFCKIPYGGNPDNKIFNGIDKIDNLFN